MTKGTKQVRCAIYTRVSTEQGLDQDFNSLHAQYDASQAYIRSQAHAGWTLVRSKYDDGGYSGGSTERPALQRLLEDIRAGKVNIIVVYKVDRLTRSLADFAKLVELFDKHGVSFVSVTQQFNTTTSMGRLTLNVLLSFAQFEREVTSERIRDKVAASKRKGLWVGGSIPLGYAVKDRKIVIVPEEAERVRSIFQTYLRLGSLNKVMEDLRKRSIVTKLKRLKDGRSIGGIPFTRGPLAYLLNNRFYIGDVVFKGETLKGEQAPIIDRGLFEAVQAKCAAQRIVRGKIKSEAEALLTGRIFDDRGHRMTPTHCVKKGVRYRYYISTALLHGQSSDAGSMSRVPGPEIEAVAAKAVRQRIENAGDLTIRDLLDRYVARVQVQSDALEIELKPSKDDPDEKAEVIQISWQKPPTKRRREIMLPADPTRHRDERPIRAESRARLIAAIARGRRWLNEIATGVADVDGIAARERCSARKVNMTISLCFLAPDIVKAAIEGKLPRGMGFSRLCDAPAEWAEQYHALGLARA
jgi:site-specific DNA recombinase